MVYRVYSEKKKQLAHEAMSLLKDIRDILLIKSITDIRIINRYDVENIDKELFEYAKKTVFSEPQVDIVSEDINTEGGFAFAVEFLPGQFDQRADSAAQCIQIISKKERPPVRTAKVYVIYGNPSEKELGEVKKYVINPVESREAELKKPETLEMKYEIPSSVKVLEGFTDMTLDDAQDFIDEYGLAMDKDDLMFCVDYFKQQQRQPTITELRMIDTYWSDHCRHTTFLTTIDSVKFEDELLQKTYDEYIKTREAIGRTKPVNLMDIGTICAKYLKKEGKLDKLDESEEINACTVKIKIEVDGKEEDYLLLFKNETHNHPTEIEPFGGAATCIGGAIRDPLSGRAYVYGAMRVTGAANPLKPVSETLEGKLPQRKIVTTAAAGYSSYGNQIGLSTGIVDEIYHDGYAAKRMEIGAVIGSVPEKNVRRECPSPGDVVILLGGRTGRDGCGGATGSSKSHTLKSLESCGAEVQKGNAPEERKLQRLFRNSEASRMIKRCNDFGAGGVSVAIGELADGILIDLNKVPKKYEGLDGTELAISESQERMAVVVEKNDEARFIELANAENLEATTVAVIQEEKRLKMTWNGNTIVDLTREFLNSNGAEKHIDIVAEKLSYHEIEIDDDFSKQYLKIAGDLNICSKKGLSERFDSTIGAGTVLMPFGGKYQETPIQAMVNEISTNGGHTDDCSLMAWGYNPFISEKSPYHGAYLAVVESVCKLVAAGGEFKDVYLTFQEYFERPGKNPARWGKPLAALLGAYKAQMDYEIAAIGGKDSMSGSFEKLDVPPTLVSFAVTNDKTENIISPEFKKAGNKLILIKSELDENRLPKKDSLKKVFEKVTELIRSKKTVSCYTPTIGGIAEAVLKMAVGNRLGFAFDADKISKSEIFGYNYGAFLLEVPGGVCEENVIGTITWEASITFGSEKVSLEELHSVYENKLESVYPLRTNDEAKKLENLSYSENKEYKASIKVNKPKVLIPVFPGTNCEYDSMKAVNDAGASAEVFVINNLSSNSISKSVEEFAKKVNESQIIFIPGGFSGGDEPEGSGKFITAFFRNPEIKEAVTRLLESRDGLMCGICNGFQAFIKLGLVPYGKIIDTDEHCPTISFNTIGRHQSKIVATRVVTDKSPWLKKTKVGEVYHVPISHGEGRFIVEEELMKKLIENGQIATQYVDFDSDATSDIMFNPNNSAYAVEGIISPDGRVIGKMGHSERIGKNLYKNVCGNYDMKLFEAAVEYFK